MSKADTKSPFWTSGRVERGGYVFQMDFCVTQKE